MKVFKRGFVMSEEPKQSEQPNTPAEPKQEVKKTPVKVFFQSKTDGGESGARARFEREYGVPADGYTWNSELGPNSGALVKDDHKVRRRKKKQPKAEGTGSDETSQSVPEEKETPENGSKQT
jgi:hypothetical protein